MRWYVSKIRNTLNRRPFIPEMYSDYICVSPYYPANLHRVVNVLLDSGAFQDVDKDKRLSFDEALRRQLACEKKCGFTAERIVSYDHLVDEKLIDGKKVKARWGSDAADNAVRDTITAAHFLSAKRRELAPRQLVLSNQGTTIEQYERCVRGVLEVASHEDCIGYGGFCIIGQRLRSVTVDDCSYPEQFHRILERTAPFVAEAGIREAHVFGVMHLPTLRKAASILRRYGIEFSTDSSAVERRSVIEGWIWDDDGFKHKYDRSLKWIGEGPVPKGRWHPNILAHENIKKAIKTLEEI